MEFLSAVIGLVLLVSLYFLPLIIAASRRHRNVVAIGMTNALLGWTFLGWVVALIWSATYQPAKTSE